MSNISELIQKAEQEDLLWSLQKKNSCYHAWVEDKKYRTATKIAIQPEEAFQMALGEWSWNKTYNKGHNRDD